MKDVVTISKEKWQKLARILGDTNPIHYDDCNKYGFREPICPGIYLYSLAEKEVRESNDFKLPIEVRASFTEPVFDDEVLHLQKESLFFDDGRKSFRLKYTRDDYKIAEFSFNEISQYENYKILSDFQTETYKIDRDKFDTFNEVLDLKDNETVYSAFVLGGVLRNFLNGKEGSLLHKMKFEFYKPLNLSDITTYIDIEEKLKSENKKIKKLEYTIYGKAIQNGIVISMGKGVAMHKLIKN